MITGAQIRQARELLGWPPTRLAQRAKVHSAIVRRAESVDGEPPQAALVCRERSIVRGDGGRFTTPPPSRGVSRSTVSRPLRVASPQLCPRGTDHPRSEDKAMRLARLVVALVLLIAAVAGAYWWVTADESGPKGFQGYVEGNLVYMAPEEGGRIDKMEVDAGDEAKEGQLLFGLESAMQIGQRNEAEARLRQAEAQLANLKAAQQRPEQIAVLRAQEERAKAQLQFSKNEYERQQTLFQRGITAKAQLDNAKAAFDRDQAAVDEAQRAILAAQLASRSDEIGAAEAALHAAEAALAQAETRLARRRVLSPANAKVQDVFFRAGEVVNAGQPVLSLLPPQNL